MTSQAFLRVPISAELYDKLKCHAAQLGFDSAQAYIRYWATLETGQQAEQDHLEIHKRQAVRYFELVLAMRPSDFPTMEHAVTYVLHELYNTRMRNYLRKALSRTVDKQR